MTVALSSFFGALLLGSPLVLALGTVAFALLAAWQLSRPVLWQEMLRAPERDALASVADLADPTLRVHLTAIAASRQALEVALGGAPESLCAHLARVIAAREALEARASILLQRADQLYKWMRPLQPDLLRTELERAAARARDYAEPITREERAKLSVLRERQLAAVRGIERLRERLLARLDAIVAAVEGLPARILWIRAQPLASAEGTYAEDIGQLEADLRSLDGDPVPSLTSGDPGESLCSYLQASGGA